MTWFVVLSFFPVCFRKEEVFERIYAYGQMSACVSYLSAFQENSRGSARRVCISFHPISNQTNDSTEEAVIT